MEFFTMNRKFIKQDTIDKYVSGIFTERYYGDSEVEIVVPATVEMIQKLYKGVFVGIPESDEIMILETREFEKGTMKVSGISLLKWMNNRFIRTSAEHEDRYWALEGVPGVILANIVQQMLIGGPFLDGSVPINIPNPARYAIPGLALGGYDQSGSSVAVGVPYGPLYDALHEIAVTYELGMKIRLMSTGDSGYLLNFRNYRGIDRTSTQTLVPIIRFSPQMDSLTDIKELESISGFKTETYAFAPGNPDGLATTPGSESLISMDGSYTGFDLRTQLIFCEDITTDQVDGEEAKLVSILNSRARDALAAADRTQVVDGEISSNAQFKYGRDYAMGDLVEIQGNSGAISVARVTEYIHTQDVNGYKAYPTMSIKE